MPFNTSIVSTIAITSVGTYALYKYLSKNYTPNPPLDYRVFECEQYPIISPARVYKYDVPTGNFTDLELAYRSDLFGNYKKKEHIDKLFKKYLEKNTISQKHIIVNTEGYIADINIENNPNEKTLVFELDNNSLFEAKLDAKNKK